MSRWLDKALLIKSCKNCGHDIYHAGESNPFMRGMWVHRSSGSRYCDEWCTKEAKA